MITADTIKRGFLSGLMVTWELSNTIIPVYFIVTILKHTPALTWISDLMIPFMKIVGLPGEASIVLVLGYLVNIYAALGAILSFDLSVKEITIIAAMLLIAHSLPVETAVSKRTGVKVFSLVLVRVIGSFLIGILFNFCM